MRLLHLVAVGLLACILPCRVVGVAHAQQPEATGRDESVRRFLAVEGKQVPLPDGNWIIAGRAPSPGTPITSPSVVSMVLMRLDGSRVDAAIVIQTNRMHSRVKWGSAPLCASTSLYFAHIRYASEHDSSCAYAAYVATSLDRGTRIEPAWRQATQVAESRGWHLPSIWVDVAFRVTDRRDALQIRYLFDPMAGAGQGRTTLTPENIQSLADWATTNWDTVDSGFRNRIPTDGAFKMEDWRLSTHASGAKPVSRPDTEPDMNGGGQIGHLGVKMLTYRVFGTLTDLTVNYFWLGSLPSASGLAVVGGIASSSLYFVHELVWSRFEQPTEQTNALPGIGYEGPPPVPVRPGNVLR